MPCYPRKCVACTHRFEVICGSAQRNAIKCVKCGAGTEADFSRLTFKTEALVLGKASVSKTHSVIPQEVGDARRLFEGDGIRVRDDGRIEVANNRAKARLSKLWTAAQHAAGCVASSSQFQTPDPKKGAKLRKERFMQRCRARGLKKR